MSSQLRTSRSDSSSKPQRVLACVRCQQRKVKCDRKFPCAHCVRLQVDCVPVTQPRPRRRRFAERDLLDRLRRYEGLLRRNSIDFEPLHKDSDERPRDGWDESDDAPSDSSPVTHKELRGPQEAKTIWHAMGHGLRDPKYEDAPDTVVKNAWTQSFPNDNPVLFGAQKGVMSTSIIHPEPVHIFRMWQTYLDNVDPLLKVTHTPSLQPRIIEATSNVTSIDPTMEALMFGIYCTSVLSFEADKCQAVFGLPKEELLAKYQFGCQQALLNAGFLRSDDRESLTALFLFLVSMYPVTDPRSLSSMLSIAIRIAQRIGIDDESRIRCHTAFEAEMRRRLWWSLVLFDSRIAELAEFKPASLIPTWNCRTPSNLNDSDLRVEMKELPPQGQSTEAIFVAVRGQLGDFLRHAPFHLDFTNPALKPIAKDKTDLVIMEKKIEEDFLGFCDDGNALQFMTTWAARGQLSKCHLMRHYSKYSSSVVYQSNAHREAIMFHALRMLECDTKVMTSPLTQGYLWFLQHYFPFPAYIFLTQEMRLKTLNRQFDRAWELMSENYEARFSGPGLVDTPLFRMFAELVIHTWESLQGDSIVSSPNVKAPGIVLSIRRQMAETTQSEANQAVDPPSTALPTAMNEFIPPPGFALGGDSWMWGIGAPTGMAAPEPRPFPPPGQTHSMAEMNHLNWVSMVWGLHQGRGWS